MNVEAFIRAFILQYGSKSFERPMRTKVGPIVRVSAKILHTNAAFNLYSEDFHRAFVTLKNDSICLWVYLDISF